jgi:predicted enzyme related to lactoylglutathione lyase
VPVKWGSKRRMGMIEGLGWLGTRTRKYSEMVAFYRDCLGLSLDHEQDDFTVFKLPDGSKVEVFGPSDEDHTHFDTGPVAGFEVADLEAARRRVEGGGAELIGPVHEWEPTGEAWAHFRAPDGNVYELIRPGPPTTGKLDPSADLGEQHE